MDNIVVTGGSGAIAQAFIGLLVARFPTARLFNLSRKPVQIDHPNVTPIAVNYEDEKSLAAAAQIVKSAGPVDLVIVTNGILHGDDIKPEKSLRDLSFDALMALYTANTIVPTLLAKHFLPLLARDRRAVFTALSARVGSISDNHLGGWYSYRASKSALNMILRTAAIEMQRRNPQAIVVGLHPGTVDSPLSKPFQGNVARDKLFTPGFSASCLLNVLEGLKPEDSGFCFDWQGARIEP